ncbi:MAG: hypothetical protein H8D97_00080, partial [Proteobacteria bacterium]|nr:hypothetical protein [Pseudomonadota bacterium]
MPYSIGTHSGSSTKVNYTVEKLVESQAQDLSARALQMSLITPSGYLDNVGYVTSETLTGTRSTVNPNLQVASSVVAGDANKIYTISRPMNVVVNGFNIKLDSAPSQFKNMTIELPAAPSTGSRADLVILEVWKEKIIPGSNSDCMFPMGNVGFSPSSEETTYDGCTLVSTSQTGGNWPLYLAGTYGNPSIDSSYHGKYVKADDPNIETFLNNPANNIGIQENGQFYQIRYRIATLVDCTPDKILNKFYMDWHNGGIPDKGNHSNSVFKPQGMLASRPSVGVWNSGTGSLIYQTNIYSPRSTVMSDPSLLLGALNGAPISGLSLDGFTYNIPICIVHRRNSTAYSDSNQNGAGSIASGVSGRPDSLYYDQVAKDDILDLRHRVSSSGFDVEALQQETLQQLLKSDLSTNWEESYAIATGTELVTNGTFDTDTSWNKGVGWSISGGVASIDSPASNSNLTQTLSLDNGKYYKVILDVTRTNGTLYVILGGGLQQTITTTETFTYIIASVSNDEFLIQAHTSFNGSIDNVSIKEVVPCYSTKPILKESIGNNSISTIKSTCNNSIFASPDGLRSYYSDQPGEQTIISKILNESTSEFSDIVKYNGVDKTIILDPNYVMSSWVSGSDDIYTYIPNVIKDGSTYKMWYSGYDGSYWRIHYATSTDGIN